MNRNKMFLLVGIITTVLFLIGLVVWLRYRASRGLESTTQQIQTTSVVTSSTAVEAQAPDQALVQAELDLIKAFPKDSDGDGLVDTDEKTYATDVANPDTDGDGSTDGSEVHAHKTDPLKADPSSAFGRPTTSPQNPATPAAQNQDRDQDGLMDDDETNMYGTDPLKADTDGDGHTDALEIQMGYNPLGAGKCAKANCLR